jgi:putative salt-induced outer membrane protein YdiY
LAPCAELPDARTTTCRGISCLGLPRVVLAALVMLALLPFRAFGQAAPPAPPPPTFQGSAQFSFLNTHGNASSQSLGTGGDLVWRPTPWEYKSKVDFAQNDADGVLNARSLSATFRASRPLRPRVSGYGQYDFLRDLFAGVEQRHVVEGGLSYLAVDHQPHRLELDTGLGYIHESRLDSTLNSASLSLGAAYQWTLSSTASVTYDPRFLIPFADTGAWKFDQKVSIAASLTKVFSIKVSHTVRYSARPPAGFKTTDTIMAVSLVAKLERP